jgi:transposase InsO family protein
LPLHHGHVAVPESNRRWATDRTTAWTAEDGTGARRPVIDCGGRVVLDIEVTKVQESLAVPAPVERRLEEAFGRPRSIPDGLELRSDHGPQYTGSDCEDLCDTWHLEHTFAPVTDRASPSFARPWCSRSGIQSGRSRPQPGGDFQLDICQPPGGTVQ